MVPLEGFSFDLLPRGVEILRSGAGGPRIQGNLYGLQLVLSGDGTELIRLDLKQGALYGLRPDPSFQGLEALFVLSGRLTLETDFEVSLGPGDSVSAWPVSEPVIFLAQETSSLLYVTSRPVFHSVADDVEALAHLAVQVSEKDGYTSSHCGRLQDLALGIGRSLGLPPSRLHNLLYAAFVHDVGKAEVSSEILTKPGPLTDAEWTEVKRHPEIGERMVSQTFMADAAPIVGQHHERLDGSGYPKGLQEHEISQEAQILAVIDSFDAMVSDRPYHRGIPEAAAIKELYNDTGTRYSRKVVEALEQELGVRRVEPSSDPK